ncbi:MAG TPA: L-seryl-tRNA(Sec) selenium transferase [Desulfobacteraceae bacterium]|nr:L-seryl-tRNA(Sec) selenium transferase [Desulfobacteraceae bacterium]
MSMDEKQQKLLRSLPGIDRILEISKNESFFLNIPKAVLVTAARIAVDEQRIAILNSIDTCDNRDITDSFILRFVKKHVQQIMAPNLIPVINGTGIVVHTNLGRSLLPENAVQNIISVSRKYSNLEFDLEKGKRGSRYSIVEDILCEVCGAEAAMVVNNNAAAVFICLDTMAREKEVIVSRGELVEIGGSFRIPDVMAKSGAFLKEVGTTNRTHLRDYENEIAENTALLLKVHTSNYAVLGFTASVLLKELVDLGIKNEIPVMEDLGSGSFIDFSKYGFPKEPTVQESVAAGADLVTFSGDKLLGGPQAGIILGKKAFVDRIKKNPMARVLRIDKLTLAALESVLSLYNDFDNAVETIPTLRMLTVPLPVIEERAMKLFRMLEDIGNPGLKIRLMDMSSRAGGGSLPLLQLPSKCIGLNLENYSPNSLETFMRKNDPPVIGRIEDDTFIIDLRTVHDDELILIKTALASL